MNFKEEVLRILGEDKHTEQDGRMSEKSAATRFLKDVKKLKLQKYKPNEHTYNYNLGGKL